MVAPPAMFGPPTASPGAATKAAGRAPAETVTVVLPAVVVVVAVDAGGANTSCEVTADVPLVPVGTDKPTVLLVSAVIVVPPVTMPPLTPMPKKRPDVFGTVNVE